MNRFDQLVKVIKEKIAISPEPMTREIIFLYGKDPYLILISCLLSLQTRDVVTLPVAIKLFHVAKTPQQMMLLSVADIELLIKSVNYYKTKARKIKDVSQIINDRFSGIVPADKHDLLALPGVGLKTANLVLAEGFDISAIYVDTHVHRLSNHWGLIDTKTSEQTEVALQKVIPKKYWIDWNYLLVKWGQSICKRAVCHRDECGQIQKIMKKI